MNLTLKVWRQANAKAKGSMENYSIANVSPSAKSTYYFTRDTNW